MGNNSFILAKCNEMEWNLLLFIKVGDIRTTDCVQYNYILWTWFIYRELSNPGAAWFSSCYGQVGNECCGDSDFCLGLF